MKNSQSNKRRQNQKRRTSPEKEVGLGCSKSEAMRSVDVARCEPRRERRLSSRTVEKATKVVRGSKQGWLELFFFFLPFLFSAFFFFQFSLLYDSGFNGQSGSSSTDLTGQGFGLFFLPEIFSYAKGTVKFNRYLFFLFFYKI